MIFEELIKVDIIQPILQPLYEGKLTLGTDGKITQRRQIDPSSTWVHIKLAPDRDCGKWLGVYFKNYHFIPKTCHSCFKVVVKPETISDLFKLWKLQMKLDLPAKTGLEVRPYVRSKGYVGFWYCPISEGLAGARELYKKLRAKVKENGIKGDIILKRGCTEMELNVGPSDKWAYTSEHQRLEYMLDQVFTERPEMVNQPACHVIHVQRGWIDFAWRMGDPTVFEFANPHQFQPPPVHYEDSDHKPEDFPIFLPDWMTERKVKTLEEMNDNNS